MAKVNKNQPDGTQQNAVRNPVDAEAEQGGFVTLDEAPEGVKIAVVKRFRDKLDRKTMYEAGQELEFDEERAGDVISRGLAKVIE